MEGLTCLTFLIVRDHGEHFFSRGANLFDVKFKKDEFWGFVLKKYIFIVYLDVLMLTKWIQSKAKGGTRTKLNLYLVEILIQKQNENSLMIFRSYITKEMKVFMHLLIMVLDAPYSL